MRCGFDPHNSHVFGYSLRESLTVMDGTALRSGLGTLPGLT